MTESGRPSSKKMDSESESAVRNLSHRGVTTRMTGVITCSADSAIQVLFDDRSDRKAISYSGGLEDQLSRIAILPASGSAKFELQLADSWTRIEIANSIWTLVPGLNASGLMLRLAHPKRTKCMSVSLTSSDIHFCLLAATNGILAIRDQKDGAK